MAGQEQGIFQTQTIPFDNEDTITQVAFKRILIGKFPQQKGEEAI